MIYFYKYVIVLINVSAGITCTLTIWRYKCLVIRNVNAAAVSVQGNAWALIAITRFTLEEEVIIPMVANACRVAANEIDNVKNT